MKSILNLLKRFTNEELLISIQKVLHKLPQMKALVTQREQQGLVDPEGAQQALLQLKLFEQYSQNILSLPMTLDETTLLSEPDSKPEFSLLPNDFSGNTLKLRPGTPLRILEKSVNGSFLKVAILDTRYDINYDLHQKYSSGHNEYIGFIPINTPIGTILEERLLGFTNEQDMAY